MAIPDFQSCMRPLLAAIADNQVHHFPAVVEDVANEFQLSEQEKAELLPSGKQAVYKNRMAWSRTYLKKAGLLIQPQRSHVQITELGHKALNDCSDCVNVRYLKQYESFLEFHSAKPTPSNGQTSEPEEITDPLERLEAAHLDIKQQLASEVLAAVKEQSPQFFENLVVQLMLAIGYGGWSDQSGKTTQYVADGGIDGIINEDPLGLETIYLQAKRYKDNAIGRPDIQAFVGALEMNRSRKGVFITTSKFSQEALDYVNLIEKKVVLIDGRRLADLMIEHELGVATKQVYKVKSLDTDYFNED